MIYNAFSSVSAHCTWDSHYHCIFHLALISSYVPFGTATILIYCFFLIVPLESNYHFFHNPILLLEQDFWFSDRSNPLWFFFRCSKGSHSFFANEQQPASYARSSTSTTPSVQNLPSQYQELRFCFFRSPIPLRFPGLWSQDHSYLLSLSAPDNKYNLLPGVSYWIPKFPTNVPDCISTTPFDWIDNCNLPVVYPCSFRNPIPIIVQDFWKQDHCNR